VGGTWSTPSVLRSGFSATGYCAIEPATLENTLFACCPISRIVQIGAFCDYLATSLVAPSPFKVRGAEAGFAACCARSLARCTAVMPISSG
jgi:hypothetical protein